MNPSLQGRIFDVTKGSVATATLFLALFMLPLVGLIPGTFTATPGIFYALKGGRKTGIAIVAATSAILAAVADPAAMVFYLLQAGIITIAIPEFLVRLKGGARSIVYAIAIDLVAIAIAASLFAYLSGGSLHQKVTKGIQTSIAQTALIYQKAGVTGDELKVMQESMQKAGEVIVTIYPALITVTLGVMAALNLMVVGGVAAKARMPVYIGDFQKYRNPEQLIWLLIASGFAMLVQNDIVYLVSLNVLIVVCTLYAVQGFAVIVHFFRRLAIPRFIRALGLLFLIFQPFMVLAVAALGVFDFWGDFRSPNKQQNL